MDDLNRVAVDFIGHLVIGAAGGNRLGNAVCRQHAEENRAVAALNARHIDETGRTADQRTARERELGNRLVPPSVMARAP
jgi:hypothetical protein